MVRPADAPGIGPAAADRARSAAGPGMRRVLPGLPARLRPAVQADQPRRGPGPLAAPDTWARPTAGLHPRRRGLRPDPPGRRMGAGTRCRAGRPLGARPRSPRLDQRLTPAADPPRTA